MNDVLDVELILSRKHYSKAYNLGLILLILLLISVYTSFIYKYQTYILSKGRMTNNQLELAISIENLKYVTENSQVIIDNKNYRYIVNNISQELYIDESYNNYKYVYLNVIGLNNLDNFVYEVKFKKETKKIIYYLKDYFKGGTWN